jgi:hypothetical protein
MSLEEKCFTELDTLYPMLRSTTKSSAETDEHLAAVLHTLCHDEIRRENERRAKEGLGWKITLKISANGVSPEDRERMNPSPCFPSSARWVSAASISLSITHYIFFGLSLTDNQSHR